MGKIIKFPGKSKKPDDSEFDDVHCFESHVDLKLEMHDHELRDLRNWCKDQDMKLRQLAMFCEDLMRDNNELASKYNRLLRALAASGPLIKP